jgi:hypothetical protein
MRSRAFLAFLMSTAFLYAPEGEGGDGGGGGGGGGEGGNPFGTPKAVGDGGKPGEGKPGEGGKPGEPGSGAQPYFPQNFPDHLRGANDRETIDKVFGAFSGMREDMSKRGTVPKEAKDYNLTLSENAAKVLGQDLSKDRSSQIFRNLAHKHGLTDKQASGMFSEFNDELLSAGVIKVIDPLKESKLIAGDAAVGRSDDEVKELAATRWQTTIDQVDALVNSKTVSKEGGAELKKIAETGHGLLALEALIKATGEHGLQTGGDTPAAGITKADLDKRINDPRADPRSPKFDQAFYDETDRLGRAFYSKDKAA